MPKLLCMPNIKHSIMVIYMSPIRSTSYRLATHPVSNEYSQEDNRIIFTSPMLKSLIHTSTLGFVNIIVLAILMSQMNIYRLGRIIELYLTTLYWCMPIKHSIMVTCSWKNRIEFLLCYGTATLPTIPIDWSPVTNYCHSSSLRWIYTHRLERNNEAQLEMI